MPQDGTVFDILRRPPVSVGELVAALGSSMREVGERWQPDRRSVAVPHGTASYECDPYHQTPSVTLIELARAALSDYVLQLPGGRFRCEQALRDAYGPPREVRGLRRYGNFFVDAADRDGFRLEWYRQEPDWARATADEGARWRALQGLADRIRRAPDEQHARAAADELQLDLWPSLPAAELAVALGLPGHPDAVARSVDVHMTQYVLAELRGDRVERLRVGDYIVDATVQRPSGGVVDGVRVPAGVLVRIGPQDPVTAVLVRRIG